jgi:hypothetical protein
MCSIAKGRPDRTLSCVTKIISKIFSEKVGLEQQIRSAKPATDLGQQGITDKEESRDTRVSRESMKSNENKSVLEKGRTMTKAREGVKARSVTPAEYSGTLFMTVRFKTHIDAI